MKRPYLGTPPRQIRRRSGFPWAAMGCARLFILPHMLVGFFLVLYCFLKLTLGLIGTKTDGIVLKKYTTQGSKGGTNHHLDYTFTTDGQTYTPSSQIDRETYDTLQPQAFIPIVHLPYLPKYTSDILPPGRTFPPNTLSMTLIALFWNALLSVFVYILYILPWRKKQLVIHGQEADGKIIDKDIKQQKYTRYQINYRYQGPAELHYGQESIPQPLYDTLNPGDSLKILFNPSKPQFHTVLEFSDWEII